VITACNFTQRKEAERALLESETRLRSILDGSPIPLFVIDRNHRITHWNQACERMTGMSADRMIGTQEHWRPFYDAPRPCLADLVLNDAAPTAIAQYYNAHVHNADFAECIFEGEDYFPTVGKWLFFYGCSDPRQPGPHRRRHGKLAGHHGTQAERRSLAPQ